MRIARAALVDRRRAGWALGRLAIGREQRRYRLTIAFTLVWPSLWLRRAPAPLAPAPTLDEKALAARAALTANDHP